MFRAIHRHKPAPGRPSPFLRRCRSFLRPPDTFDRDRASWAPVKPGWPIFAFPITQLIPVRDGCGTGDACASFGNA